jgi:hypothetical protein
MKNKENKKIRISLSLDPILYSLLNDKTSNRSRYIEKIIYDFYKKEGKNLSKIKL